MTAHADCTHDNTKAARAACRGVRSGGEPKAPRPTRPTPVQKPEVKATPAPEVKVEPTPKRRFGRKG